MEDQKARVSFYGDLTRWQATHNMVSFFRDLTGQFEPSTRAK
jgi:hypothetical protein